MQQDKRIKVLFIQVPPGGGSVVALYEMLKQVDPKIIHAHVLCYYKTLHTQTLEDISYCTVTYIYPYFNEVAMPAPKQTGKTILSKIQRLINTEYSSFKKYFFPGGTLLKEIKRVVINFSPDIIHHNNDISVDRIAISACSKFNIPQIVHNRSIAVYKKLLFNYYIDAYLHSKIAFNINITKAVSDNYKKLFNTKPLHTSVLHDFVDTKKFSPSNANAALLTELSLTTSDFVIADVGRIIPWKGQHVLIEALNIIKHKAPNIKALIVGPYDKGVGSEDYFEQLQLLVKKYGLTDSVIFTGNRTDIPQIINICQVIAHTAIKPEPQGLIIIEALLCKKAVIVADAGGAAEIAIKYGGTLFKPGNAPELANVILNYWQQHSINKLSPPTNYNKLLEDFDGPHQIKKIVSIYQAVISNNTTLKNKPIQV